MAQQMIFEKEELQAERFGNKFDVGILKHGYHYQAN